MIRNELIKLALENIKLNLENYIFKCKNRRNPQDFNRERKMGFKETILFMLNMVKKSLQVELNDFFENVLNQNYSVSKQAFSEARNKILPKAFIELNDNIINDIYNLAEDLELWNGYRLTAIDGTVLEIPNTEILRKEFGTCKNQSSEVARARGSIIYDVLNKVVIKSKIDGYLTSEREIAKNLIEQVVSNSKYQDLIIFDRGYPSAEMVSFLYEKKVDFLMRVKADFSNQIIYAREKDQIIYMKHNGKSYPVRVIRVMISDEIEEVLISSLLDKKLKPKDFKELYFKRWSVETKFDELKNRLQIENFTGRTKIAIEQDFYATIFLSNMAELTKQHSDGIIQEKHQNKNLKHEYKTNINTLIGTLKDKLVMILLEDDPVISGKMFDNIMKKISKNMIPIRAGRKNPRKKFLVRSKYQLNKKRCL